MGERTWLQAKLPVAMGGLGLRGAEDHAPAAYAASVLASQPLATALQDCQGAEEPVLALSQELLAALAAAQGEKVREDELIGVSQKQMSIKIDLHQQRRLHENTREEEVRERACLASLTLPHAGDWLNTAPLKCLGLHL